MWRIEGALLRWTFVYIVTFLLTFSALAVTPRQRGSVSLFLPWSQKVDYLFIIHASFLYYFYFFIQVWPHFYLWMEAHLSPSMWHSFNPNVRHLAVHVFFFPLWLKCKKKRKKEKPVDNGFVNILSAVSRIKFDTAVSQSVMHASVMSQNTLFKTITVSSWNQELEPRSQMGNITDTLAPSPSSYHHQHHLTHRQKQYSATTQLEVFSKDFLSNILSHDKNVCFLICFISVWRPNHQYHTGLFFFLWCWTTLLLP